MLRIFKQMNIRNRAYVVDSKGNKLFYGTVYQCEKFIEYIKKELEDKDVGKAHIMETNG